jgi:hypothetical protein
MNLSTLALPAENAFCAGRNKSERCISFSVETAVFSEQESLLLGSDCGSWHIGDLAFGLIQFQVGVLLGNMMGRPHVAQNHSLIVEFQTILRCFIFAAF